MLLISDHGKFVRPESAVLVRQCHCRRHPGVDISLLPLSKGNQQQVHVPRQRAGEAVFDEGEAGAFDLREPVDHHPIVLYGGALIFRFLAAASAGCISARVNRPRADACRRRLGCNHLSATSRLPPATCNDSLTEGVHTPDVDTTRIAKDPLDL